MPLNDTHLVHVRDKGAELRSRAPATTLCVKSAVAGGANAARSASVAKASWTMPARVRLTVLAGFVSALSGATYVACGATSMATQFVRAIVPLLTMANSIASQTNRPRATPATACWAPLVGDEGPRLPLVHGGSERISHPTWLASPPCLSIIAIPSIGCSRPRRSNAASRS